ncbi:MAG TPA: hypothetical protein VHP33_24425 [Polyangiaceae bacterium]|nr:hypothetical protein [Polyangiaceae bacterium]
MKLRTAAYLLTGGALVNVLGARLLDELGLIEGLLSPSGAQLALLVPVAVVFYAARFFAFFVAPGLLLGAGAAALQPHLQKLLGRSQAKPSD